ncbi:MAG TPA: hypothetical protein PLS26_12075 [Bacteroidales bacterium]|nr:hypothetical protein [Bacteroidales bacterium]HPI31253.1 hypothetical protein [Bacteroidales bacterium]
MKKAILPFLLIMFASSLFSFSQKETTEFRLSLRDGSIMTGTASISNISLLTQWGKLEIPVKNISQIFFGISPDNSQKEKIKSLVTDLNNLTEDIRKKAYETLVAMSINCIPVLEEVINSESYIPPVNTDYTAELALAEMKSTHNYDQSAVAEDIIVTDNAYRIGGTYNVKSIALKTQYGNLEIPRDKITNIDVFYKGGDMAESSFTLMANKHISGNTSGGWLKTSMYVKSGQKLSITASGEITLASLSGYKYKPDGKSTSTGNVDYDYEGDYAVAATTYPTYGNVVFKIGENGTMVKAGSSYKGTAPATGILYLSIYETVYNAANTGSYFVKVKLN